MMTTIICPVCGRRLLSIKASKPPEIYTIMDNEQPENMDMKIKCPRCRTIVGIEK